MRWLLRLWHAMWSGHWHSIDEDPVTARCICGHRITHSDWYWCPSIERNMPESTRGGRQFGLRLFAFGGVLYLGRNGWTIRVAVPR